MTEDECEKLYQKLGPEGVDHDPYVNQAFNAICDGQPVEDTLYSLVRVLVERARIAEDMVLIERLRGPRTP